MPQNGVGEFAGNPGRQLGRWPSAVIWDLDGTLIDSAPDIALSLNRLLESEGIAPHSLDTVIGMVGSGARKLVERGYAAAGIHLQAGDLTQRFEKFIDIYEADPVANTRVYPGIETVLEQLSKSGVRHGICTNKPHAITLEILSRLGIQGWFDSVIGGDSAPTRKPDPASLRLCLSELGATADTAMVIGDSDADSGAARNVGVPCILVSYGYCDVPLDSLGADAVVASPDKIIQKIDALRLIQS